jgi:hypothetical protein
MIVEFCEKDDAVCWRERHALAPTYLRKVFLNNARSESGQGATANLIAGQPNTIECQLQGSPLGILNGSCWPSAARREPSGA